jgi:hypothetical protein
VYYGAIFKEEAGPELARVINRIRLAQEFQGWTLEYIDRLMDREPWTVAEIIGVLDGQARLQEHKRGRAS